MSKNNKNLGSSDLLRNQHVEQADEHYLYNLGDYWAHYRIIEMLRYGVQELLEEQPERNVYRKLAEKIQTFKEEVIDKEDEESSL